MKLASLFSGGKDSTYALYKALEHHNVACLITIVSENKDSYMFHTPNIHLTELQAESIGIPLLQLKSQGKKEEELKELKNAIKKAKELFQIEGVVTGAIESVYQASRIQKICSELDIYCFNPLWQLDQVELLSKLLKNKFKVMISSVAAYPFDESWLGRLIDNNTILDLVEMNKKYKINPAGEGGEYESLVLDGPIFNKKIEIKKFDKNYSNYQGVLHIDSAN